MLETPPRQGPCIVASNHISHFDPAILGAFFPRAVDWMAMEKLFHYRWSARFFSSVNVIPVNRFGTDFQANRRSLHVILSRLAEGRAIGIFPEGGIRVGASSILEKAPMKPGLVTISILGKAPIIPCVILGSDRLYDPAQWFRRPQLWIIIGKAILPPIKRTTDDEKKVFQETLSAAFPALQAELCKRFHLTNDDLPKPPQARKGGEQC